MTLCLRTQSKTLLADYSPPMRSETTWPIFLSIALRDAKRISRDRCQDVVVWIDSIPTTVYDEWRIA